LFYRLAQQAVAVEPSTYGAIVGRVTSGGVGYTVERSIAYAYLPPEAGIGTRGDIDVFGEWVGFEVAREPLYDPAGERIRS
jgi:4-methylaminobutanoate oxidase (formaldehyde-forming)